MTLRKVTSRLIPFLLVLYIVAWLDRVNVGFAALQMNADLGSAQPRSALAPAFSLRAIDFAKCLATVLCIAWGHDDGLRASWLRGDSSPRR